MRPFTALLVGLASFAALLVSHPASTAPEETRAPEQTLGTEPFREDPPSGGSQAPPPAAKATGAPTPEPDPAREARIRALENQLRAAQQVIVLMQTELEALKRGEPSPLPRAPVPPETAQAPTPAPPPAPSAVTPPPPPPTPEDELAAAEEEAPSPEQERPAFTPGFLREARAVLIREGMLELDPRIRYTHNSSNLLNVAGLDIIEAVFVGRFEIGKLKRDQLQPAVALRYGWTDRLQFNFELPYVHTWSRRFLPPEVQRIPDQGRTTEVDNGGLGDISFGLSYHLWRESRRFPDVILTTSIKTDTGDGPFDVGRFESTTGTGFWGGTAGLTLVKVTDPGVLFANLGYFYHHEDKVNGVEIDPADSFSWGLGYSWSMNPFLSVSTNVNGRFVDKTEVGGNRLSGSEQTIANLALGLTYVTGNNRTFDFGLGFGLTDDSPDFSIAFSMPFSFHVGNVLEWVF